MHISFQSTNWKKKINFLETIKKKKKNPSGNLQKKQYVHLKQMYLTSWMAHMIAKEPIASPKGPHYRYHEDKQKR